MHGYLNHSLFTFYGVMCLAVYTYYAFYPCEGIQHFVLSSSASRAVMIACVGIVHSLAAANAHSCAIVCASRVHQVTVVKSRSSCPMFP